MCGGPAKGAGGPREAAASPGSVRAGPVGGYCPGRASAPAGGERGPLLRRGAAVGSAAGEGAVLSGENKNNTKCRGSVREAVASNCQELLCSDRFDPKRLHGA